MNDKDFQSILESVKGIKGTKDMEEEKKSEIGGRNTSVGSEGGMGRWREEKYKNNNINYNKNKNKRSVEKKIQDEYIERIREESLNHKEKKLRTKGVECGTNRENRDNRENRENRENRDNRDKRNKREVMKEEAEEHVGSTGGSGTVSPIYDPMSPRIAPKKNNPKFREHKEQGAQGVHLEQGEHNITHNIIHNKSRTQNRTHSRTQNRKAGGGTSKKQKNKSENNNNKSENHDNNKKSENNNSRRCKSNKRWIFERNESMPEIAKENIAKGYLDTRRSIDYLKNSMKMGLSRTSNRRQNGSVETVSIRENKNRGGPRDYLAISREKSVSESKQHPNTSNGHAKGMHSVEGRGKSRGISPYINPRQNTHTKTCNSGEHQHSNTNEHTDHNHDHNNNHNNHDHNNHDHNNHDHNNHEHNKLHNNLKELEIEGEKIYRREKWSMYLPLSPIASSRETPCEKGNEGKKEISEGDQDPHGDLHAGAQTERAFDASSFYQIPIAGERKKGRNELLSTEQKEIIKYCTFKPATYSAYTRTYKHPKPALHNTLSSNCSSQYISGIHTPLSLPGPHSSIISLGGDNTPGGQNMNIPSSNPLFAGNSRSVLGGSVVDSIYTNTTSRDEITNSIGRTLEESKDCEIEEKSTSQLNEGGSRTPIAGNSSTNVFKEHPIPHRAKTPCLPTTAHFTDPIANHRNLGVYLKHTHSYRYFNKITPSLPNKPLLKISNIRINSINKLSENYGSLIGSSKQSLINSPCPRRQQSNKRKKTEKNKSIYIYILIYRYEQSAIYENRNTFISSAKAI